MNLVTRTTEYPNGTKVTEQFEVSEPEPFPAFAGLVYDQESETFDNDREIDPNIIEFRYDGLLRVVQNPQILNGARRFGGWNVLLGGVELYRDGEATNEYKNFSLDRIQAV